MNPKEQESLAKLLKDLQSALTDLHYFIYTTTIITKDKKPIIDSIAIASRSERASKILARLHAVQGGMAYLSTSTAV